MMYWYGGYSGGWESEFLTRVGGGRLKEMKDEDQKEQSFYSLTVAPSHMDHLHSFFYLVFVFWVQLGIWVEYSERKRSRVQKTELRDILFKVSVHCIEAI